MKPRISFTFPYRWLVDEEDRKFLKKNLTNLAGKNMIRPSMHPTLQAAEGFVNNYMVLLKYHSYDPVDIPLTKEEVKKIFKDTFPGANLLDFKKRFVQVESSTQLPIIEMEIYW